MVVKKLKGEFAPKNLYFNLVYMPLGIVLLVSDNMNAAPGRILDKSRC